jgi:hypothetical protein
MKSGIVAPSRVNLQRPFRPEENAKGCGQTAPHAPDESTAAPDETHVVLDELVDGLSPGADGTELSSAPPPYLSPGPMSASWSPHAADREVVTSSVIRVLSSAVIASACACVSRPAVTTAASRAVSAATSLSTSVA